SKRSRINTGDSDKEFLGDDNEWLMTFCKDDLKKQHTDFFVFGHRHLPLDLKASETSRYINLGEWINYCTYAEFDGEKLELKKFEG
nr:UDP-2,3-diacylglucosamine diphosphatase [Bacteroidia bacterium]